MTLALLAGPDTPAPALPSPASGAAAPGPRAAGRRSAGNYLQDAGQAERVAGALSLLQSVMSQPSLTAQLAVDGYPAERLAEGLALHAAAQAAYQARQHAIAALSGASAALKSSRLAAELTYREFRLCALAIYTGAGERRELAVGGRWPSNTRLLLVQARTSYAAAAQAPYAAALAQTGFGPEHVAAAQAGLDALEAALAAVPSAGDQARRATQARNAAASAFFAWMRRFRTVLSVSRRRLDAARTEPQSLPTVDAVDWAAALA